VENAARFAPVAELARKYLPITATSAPSAGQHDHLLDF
jgi:hypothetical protein